MGLLLPLDVPYEVPRGHVVVDQADLGQGERVKHRHVHLQESTIDPE